MYIVIWSNKDCCCRCVGNVPVNVLHMYVYYVSTCVYQSIPVSPAYIYSGESQCKSVISVVPDCLQLGCHVSLCVLQS